jgi:hypothetical protein
MLSTPRWWPRPILSDAAALGVLLVVAAAVVTPLGGPVRRAAVAANAMLGDGEGVVAWATRVVVSGSLSVGFVALAAMVVTVVLGLADRFVRGPRRTPGTPSAETHWAMHDERLRSRRCVAFLAAAGQKRTGPMRLDEIRSVLTTGVGVVREPEIDVFESRLSTEGRRADGFRLLSRCAVLGVAAWCVVMWGRGWSVEAGVGVVLAAWLWLGLGGPAPAWLATELTPTGVRAGAGRRGSAGVELPWRDTIVCLQTFGVSSFVATLVRRDGVVRQSLMSADSVAYALDRVAEVRRVDAVSAE